MFINRYGEIYDGDQNWKSIKSSKDTTYNWSAASTYIKSPPFFDEEEITKNEDIVEARILAMLGDSVTTDHISPAGSIKQESPAGKYLSERQINQQNYNSYGSRRGNHEIMMRGTFANIRIRNEILSGKEGGFTFSFVSNREMSIYDAAMEYKENNIPLIVIAGKEYGTGASRDWAAKGTKLLGIRAVIAESFERIHRSNLIGMGVLPLEFMEGQNSISLGLNGFEEYEICDLEEEIKPGSIKKVRVTKENSLEFFFDVLIRIDTEIESDYYKHGGLLPYVLRQMISDIDPDN